MTIIKSEFLKGPKGICLLTNCSRNRRDASGAKFARKKITLCQTISQSLAQYLYYVLVPGGRIKYLSASYDKLCSATGCHKKNHNFQYKHLTSDYRQHKLMVEVQLTAIQCSCRQCEVNTANDGAANDDR